MTRLYVIYFLAFVSATFRAQTYFPFPADSAEWDINFTCQVPFCPPNTLKCPSQTIQKGDTIINSLLYHKLYEKGSSTLHSFYREAGKKIFSKYPTGGIFGNDTAEFVLYDFNLNVGDSLQVKVPSSWMGSGPLVKQPVIYLNSTGTITVNFLTHKTYSFTSNNCSPCPGIALQGWIEGVGSNSGFFYNLNYYPWGACMSNPAPYYIFLTCFSRNNYLYPYTSGGCATFIPENNYPLTSFLVIPNPSTGNFKIKSTTQPIYIYVTNLLGQKILDIENPLQEVNFEAPTKGMYFIFLNFGHKTEMQKIIIN